MTHADSVINHILFNQNIKKDITPIWAIKFVIIANGWSLAIREERLIDENIYACKHGPLVISSYHRLKTYGTNKINVDIERENYYKTFGPSMIIPNNDILIITETLEKYAQLSDKQISIATHTDGSPWFEYTRDGIININTVLPDHIQIKCLKPQLIHNKK